MPRAPVVSREMKVTKASCLVIDMQAGKPNMYTKDLFAGRVYKTEDALIEALRKMYESDTFKVAKVKSFAPAHVRATQSAEDFIVGAEVKEVDSLDKEEEE